MIKRFAINNIFVFLLAVASAYAQAPKHIFLTRYNEMQKKNIRENWGQYFKTDILSALNAGSDFLPVKLDSYGSLYPEETLLEGINDMNFADPNKSGMDMHKFSLFDMIKLNHATFLSNVSSKYPALKTLIPGIEYKSYFENYNNLESFYKKWDSITLNKVTQQLSAKINNGGYNQVIFFVHGYNVPYSLANVQCIVFKQKVNEIISSDKNQTVKNRRILYVPVFWPSNAQKNNIIDSATFNIEDTKSGLKGLKNGIYFQFYSSRAYYSAVTLRKIINQISTEDNKCQVKIFCHSLGASVGTTALINTFSKLNSDFHETIERTNPDSDELEYFKIKEPVNYDLYQLLSKTPLPKQRITVFLSAAAIPGQNTFCDIDSATSVTKKYFVCINYKDTMLTKSGIILFGRKIPGIDARKFSATTLGCDYKGEVDATRNFFTKRGLKNNFESLIVSKNTDHDILTYFLQPDYIKFISLFLKE